MVGKGGIDMRNMSFSEAVEDALLQAMIEDPRIVYIGEDAHTYRTNLYVRFGEKRVRPAPISEAAFLGAAVTAAMSGLRPVVEFVLVDFVGVALDALLNHAAKVKDFSGGKWNVPLVVRAPCGGGYGDGGQHEQSLWGWLAHIPGLSVVVPSNPADAGRLMLTALEHDDPVIYCEHGLLADAWLEYMGRGGRKSVEYDIPPAGTSGSVPDRWDSIPLGKAAVVREGKDLTLVSLGVGVHRCLEAAIALEDRGASAGVVDLRSVAPLDGETIKATVAESGRMLVVDEDYKYFGLSGELAASVMEAGIPAKFRRVCTETTIPYSRHMEDETLPSTKKVLEAAVGLLEE
jgi:pyruvate dehydrogenase E1 component beta subunit